MPATPLLYAESLLFRIAAYHLQCAFHTEQYVKIWDHSTGAGEMASEKKKTSLGLLQGTFQRLTGIEPASQPWEGRILPMNYNRVFQPCQYTISIRPRQQLLYLSPMCHGQQTEGGQFPPSGRFGRFEMSAALPSTDLFNSNIVRGFGTAEPLCGSYSRINLRRKWAGVFFADCGPLREVRGFHDSVIARCNLKKVKFYRFPGQDLCDSHLCRGCHPPILLSAVNFRQNGYCPRQNIREQNSDSVLCT